MYYNVFELCMCVFLLMSQRFSVSTPRPNSIPERDVYYALQAGVRLSIASGNTTQLEHKT